MYVPQEIGSGIGLGHLGRSRKNEGVVSREVTITHRSTHSDVVEHPVGDVRRNEDGSAERRQRPSGASCLTHVPRPAKLQASGTPSRYQGRN